LELLLLPALLFVFGSRRVQELRILCWLLVDWWPSVPEAPPFHRMDLAAPHAGRRCSQTLDMLLSKSLALFPPLALDLAMSSSCQGDSTDVVADCSQGKGANRKRIMEPSL